MSAVLELAAELIRRPSVTPDDGGCQDLLGARLQQAGFALEPMPVGEVHNLWARRGSQAPLLCFAGHTDVVPPGPEEAWETAPFDPVAREGWLHGRGAADMKGGLAAIVCAIEAFVAANPQHRGSVAVLLTSDEEGPALDGTRAAIERLRGRGEQIDYCLIGEPSARVRSGDRIRNGRRGSLNVQLEVRGVQGHVAYPELARNPVHEALAALDELARHTWDQGTDAFPPTSLQFTDVHAGVGASNVTPASLSADFNLRFSPASDAAGIEAKINEVLVGHSLDYKLKCTLSGEPFFTPPGALTDAAREAVLAAGDEPPEFSTGGGTSDGRFIAGQETEVIELGPPGATLHQVNERVEIAELERLVTIYIELMRRLLG